MRHIHLDAVGGIAGDMFVAAVIAAFPDLGAGAARAATNLSGVACRIAEHNDGVLTGLRFVVEDDPSGNDHRHDHDHDHGHDHHRHDHPRHHDHGHARPRGYADNRGHDHTAFAAIRQRIEHADLPPTVTRHAIGIFSTLAQAEARVHGVAPDDVMFHEVGAADSIADIIAAGWLIAALAPSTWSVSSLPLGGGRVTTAHGVMPVPTPAAALLLEGFATHDDGVMGERVTPTGAAILRYLDCGPRPAGRLARSGFGFGTRRLPGMSNCLRVLSLDTAETGAAPAHRDLSVISFEVDDQSGEDLAAGLDRVRSLDGVHDIVQMAAFGKKNRLAVHVQVLVKPSALEAAIEACFRETTTIGLRTHEVKGRALPRRFSDVVVNGHAVRVKLADRPGGTTGKAEADQVLALEGHAARVALKRAAETKAGMDQA